MKSSGTTTTITVPVSGVATGNSIIVTFAMDPVTGTGTVSCTDTRSNSYAVDKDITNGSGTTGVRTVILSAHNVLSLVSGNTISCSHPSVSARALSANEFSGIAPITPKDQAAAAPGNSTAPSSGSTATTTQSVELLLGAIGVEGPTGDTFMPGTSYTTIVQGRAGTTGGNAASNITVNPEYRLVTATGAYSATGTLGTSRQWAAAVVTYKAAATATKLVITSVNGGANPIAGTPFSVVVQSQNASGAATNVVNSTGVRLDLQTGTGILGGTVTGIIAAGANQVTISGVTYTKAESGVVLRATQTSGDALTAGDSAPFTVNPGNPTTLAFTTQPGNANAGSTIPGPPTVTVRDTSGNTVTSSTASITVAIGTNPGGGTLSGTTTKNASSGVASFADLSINQAGNGYTLTASSTQLTAATSSAFNVIVLTPDLVVSSLSNPPTSAVVGGSFSVTDTTANNGNGSAGATTTNYRLSLDSVITTADPLLTGTRSVPALAASANSSGTVTVSIPTSLAPGTYFLGACADSSSVIAESNETNNCLASTGTVTVSGAPNVISLSVTSGSIGTSVTITGSNFGATQGASTVTFNGTAATPTSWSDTSIVTSVPSGATTGLVVVTVSGVASNGTSFTVATTGTISGTIARASDSHPVSGALVEALQSGAVTGSATSGADGGYSISGLTSGNYDIRASAGGYSTQTQTGVAVNGSATVNFNLNPALNTEGISYFYDELGRLKAVVNPIGEGATYSYDSVGNLLSISRYVSSQVSIIEFTPNSSPIGTSVTIFGTGFFATASQNTVTFNGASATATSATATQIVTTVPSGATTGPIGVVTPTGSAISASVFTISASSGAPTITGFTPTIGPAGTAVTINGTNFETSPARNKVTFNISYSTITSATSTTITTSVPNATGSGRISVSTPSGKATSSADFFVPPSPFTAADVEFTGRMAIGETKTVTISTVNKVGLVVFDGTAGQRVSLSISGVTMSPDWTDVYILKPDGTTLASQVGWGLGVGPGGSFFDTMTLPITGTYTIFMNPSGTTTGSMTLTLYNVPPDFTGTITPGGPSVTVTTTTPGQNAKLTFSGTTGQRVSLSLSNVTIPGSDVYIYNPDGTTLVSAAGWCCGVGTGGAFFDTLTLPATGTYTIFISPAGANTGSMTLTLYDIPADVTGTITAGGSSVTVTTSSVGQNARVTFSGTAGQRVSLSLSNVTIAGSDVYIYNPDGTTLVSAAGWCCGVGTGGAFFDTLTLPATGTYTIFINPGGTNTGSMTLTLYDIPADVTGTITPGGPSVTVTTSSVGQNARVTFSGTAGQRVSLSLSNVTIPGSDVYIYNPNGTTLASAAGWCCGIGPGGGFFDTLTLPATGTYTIFINPGGTNTGSMTLTLYDVPPDFTGTITAGGPSVTVTTTTPGQNANLTFGGTTGQRVTLSISGVTMTSSWTDVYIYNPDGTTLASQAGWCCGVGTGGAFFNTMTLPTTGTYTIFMNPTGTGTGSMTLTLNNVP